MKKIFISIFLVFLISPLFGEDILVTPSKGYFVLDEEVCDITLRDALDEYLESPTEAVEDYILNEREFNKEDNILKEYNVQYYVKEYLKTASRRMGYDNCDKVVIITEDLGEGLVRDNILVISYKINPKEALKKANSKKSSPEDYYFFSFEETGNPMDLLYEQMYKGK